MARVSVIIPTYNAAEYLADAMDSLLRQTYTDWEAVVVDAGSKDATRAVFDSYQPRFGGRLRWVDQAGRGLSGGRNTAIRASQGELIALLDADDVWLDQRLERGVAMLDARPEVGLVHAQVRRIDREGLVTETPPVPAVKYLDGEIAPHIYTRRAHLLCPTILFRKSCLEQAGYFDEDLRATEDRDLWFRIARLYPVAYIPEVLAHYRISPNAISRDQERLHTGQVRFLDKYRDLGLVSRRLHRQGLANLHRERGDVLFNRRELDEALRWYAKAVSYDPWNAANVYMLVRALGEPLLRRMRKPAPCVS